MKDSYHKYANAMSLLIYIHSNNDSEDEVDPVDYVIKLPDNELNCLVGAYNKIEGNEKSQTNKDDIDDCIEFIDWITDTMSGDGRVFLESLFGIEDAGVIALQIQCTRDHKLPMPLRFFCLLDIKKQMAVASKFMTIKKT